MLNPQQLQTLKYSASQGGMPAGNPSASMNDDQFDAWKTGSLQTPAPSSEQSPVLTALNPIKATVDAAKGGFQHAKEGVDEIMHGGGATGGVAAGAEGALKVGSGIASIATSPLAEIFKPLGFGIDQVAKIVSESPTLQRFAMSSAGQATAHVAGDVGDAANIAGTIAGTKGSVEVAPAVADTASSAVGALKDAIAPAEATPETEAAAQAKNDAAAQASHQKASTAIDNEVRNTAAKYPSVGKLLNQAEVARGTDPISVLSSYGEGKALPTLKNGKLQVDGATKFLSDQVSRLADIKNGLVGTSKDVIPVQDFQSRANAVIDGQNAWSLAKKATAKADVQKLTDTWKDIYPDGIPNKELDSLKTEHTAESNSYTSKSPFSLDAHAIVGKTARQLVESNVGDAPLQELNKLISSHYDAVKLLNSMRGKAPHGGALSKMFNNTIGEVGGMAGGMAVGHPFLGAMVGRAGAEAVNEIINNHFISNPLKRAIVNNMKGADPQVVQKALDYLETNSPPAESTPNAPARNPELPE